jgi:hypothetical protein
MWVLLRTKSHWGSIFSKYFRFLWQLLFPQSYTSLILSCNDGPICGLSTKILILTIMSRDWLHTGIRLVIEFIENLQNVTTSNYSAISNSHTLQSLQHVLIFSVCFIFTGCRLVTASNAVACSVSVFTSLLSGDWLTTNSYSWPCHSSGG